MVQSILHSKNHSYKSIIWVFTILGFIFLFGLIENQEAAQNCILIILFIWLFTIELRNGSYRIEDL